MQNFLIDGYDWLRALHVISVIFWMAGMAYLPRLFVYHRESDVGSDKSETFKVMERRLLRGIINPAMISTFLFGILMLIAVPDWLSQPWMHAKLFLVFLMSGLHGFFARWRKQFERDERPFTSRFFRIVNEGPPVLVVFIVILVIVKPF